MYSDGGRFTQGTSRRRLRHSLSKRHMCAGSQVKPASSSATRNVGNWSNTPSLTMLVSWVAKTWAMPTYSSKKNDGQPEGVGGLPGAPPKWIPATRSWREVASHHGWERLVADGAGARAGHRPRTQARRCGPH